MNRFLFSGALAVVLGLVAFGVQLGVLGELSGALAAPNKCFTVSAVPPGGDAATVCGSSTANTQLRYTVKLVSTDSAGHVTAIAYSVNGGPYSRPIQVMGTSSVSIGNGLNISFDRHGSNNKPGSTTWSFTVKPGCPQKPVSSC